MKTLIAFCVILLHQSLISCRTVPHSELDLPNEDMDSPTEEIANILIPLIEKTLEKNNNKRARKLIQMLPYNESAEASRWSRFSKKRVVEIMPLRRKQRRGEKPLAYLLAAPHSDTERRESRRGRKHETEDIDVKHDIEHQVDPNNDSGDSIETKLHDYVQRRGNAIQRNHETTEESKEHGDASESGSQSYSGSSEEDSRVEEPLDYDDHDDSADAARQDDSGDRSNQSDDDDLSDDENSSDREELKDNVSENVESEVQERDDNSDDNGDEVDNITEDTREEIIKSSNDDDESEENVALNVNEEENTEHVHKSDEIDDVSDDSDDDQYWGTKELSFEGILDNNDSFLNSDTNNESLEIDSDRSTNCRRMARIRDNVSEGDRRHEHKSYRLSFLFNR